MLKIGFLEFSSSKHCLYKRYDTPEEGVVAESDIGIAYFMKPEIEVEPPTILSTVARLGPVSILRQQLSEQKGPLVEVRETCTMRPTAGTRLDRFRIRLEQKLGL